jgi:hypothetical protein
MTTPQDFLTLLSGIYKSKPDYDGNITNFYGATQLELQEDCDPGNLTTFQATVAIRVDSNVSSASETDLARFTKAIVESYNQENFLRNDICDPYARQALNATIDLDFALNRRSRHLANSKNSSTTAPTSAPTEIPLPPIACMDILLVITGSCFGCPKSQSLFDDVQNRRRNLEQTSSLASNYSCMCPDDEDNVELRGPYQDEVVDVFVESLADLPYQIASLLEVDPVECPPVTQQSIELMIEVELTVIKSVVSDGNRALLEAQFLESYALLSRQYCDPTFQSLQTASILNHPFKRGVDVEVVFQVERQCRDCDNSSDYLFSPSSVITDFGQRKLESDLAMETCYCATFPIDYRPPTYDEFVLKFEEDVNALDIWNVVAPTDAPEPSSRPTALPSMPFPSTPPSSRPTALPSTPFPSTPSPSTPFPSTPFPSTPFPSTPFPSTPFPSEFPSEFPTDQPVFAKTPTSPNLVLPPGGLYWGPSGST